MNQAAVRSAFQRRYDALCSRMRRVQIARAACWCGLLLTAGVAGLAAADYFLELPWDTRAVALAAWGTAVLTGFGVWCVVLLRRWNRVGTAIEIERRFPDLGQSLRTTVQFGNRPAESLRDEGIAPSLLAALEIETDALTQALSIHEIIPVGRLQRAAVAMLATVLAMLVGTAADWQWRTATQRALLARMPYTRMEVAPGHATVRVGESLPVSVALRGRTDRTVALLTRSTGRSDAPWISHEVTPVKTAAAGERSARFTASLDRIRAPLEYRVTAGDLQSAVHRIDVRYPLRVEDLQIELEPPAYTRLPPSTVSDGNLNVIEGTRARFRIELDRPPAHASIHLTEHGRDPKHRPEPQAMPVRVEGAVVTLDLELTTDAVWQLDARDEDGTRLLETKYNIRVRPDRPPQVWFEEPHDPIAVHTLAEILMRMRARDDIGLSKAAIVFQINSDQEHELVLEDFQQAAEELQTAGRLSPRTQAALERKLPLEYFELTQKDSVTYWAYAEDNRPGTPHRTLTDLRFIDIRPFKQIFRQPDDMGMGAGGPRVTSLEEIIARQRFALNRALRMARQPDGAAPLDLNALDRLISFQGELAGLTRALAAFFEDRDNDAAELIYAAETSMLAAVDSLSVGKYENATLQQRDALESLIAGRNRIEILLRQGNSPLLQNALGRFNRTMMTKLRRDQDEADDAQDLVQRLQQLAGQQQAVAGALAAMTGQNRSGQGSGTASPDSEMPPQGASGSSEDETKDAPPDKAGDGEAQPMSDAEGNTGEGDEPPQDGNEPQGPATRQEIEDRQLDIVLEATELQKLMQTRDDITELARQRMDAAMQTADAASAALTRGSTEDAAGEARQAAGMLRELTRHVEGLLSDEPARQIALSRGLAAELSVREDRLADAMRPTPQTLGGRGWTERSEGSPGRALQPGGKTGASQSLQPRPPTEKEGPDSRPSQIEEARQLAEMGRTLDDVLKDVARSYDPRDREVINGVEDILTQEQVPATVQRMQAMAAEIEERPAQAVETEARDLSDRLEIVAARLDELHRTIVAPRIEALRRLEDQAAEMERQLERLETETQVSEWQGDAARMVADLEKAGVAGGAAEELREALEGGAGTDSNAGQRNRTWIMGGRGFYNAPKSHTTALRKLVADLQEQIQLLALGDLLATGDEAVPPEYEHLVDRYYKVLSSDSRGE